VTGFLLRRLASSAVVLAGVSVITFALARLLPGDAAAAYLGPRARPEALERVREQLGLDEPLHIQYLVYMRDMVTGDWGTSLSTKQPVLESIMGRVPASLELIAASLIIALPIGLVLGMLSARWHGRPVDVGVRIVSIIGVSIPAFFLGVLLQMLFFRQLDLLPLSGRVDSDLRFTSPISDVTGIYIIDALVTANWTAFTDVTWHLILPAITLAAYPIGLISRMTRSSMLETLNRDFVRTARAFGLRERVIVGKLALRNALVPLLTVLGLTLAYLITGTFYVEFIFNWPGLGTFTVDAILATDYPAIMGIALVGAAAYVLINLLVDLAQAWVDPRIRLD
jgi:ABC-type dipeptide/oligopeptide/nickel transport system permease component